MFRIETMLLMAIFSLSFPSAWDFSVHEDPVREKGHYPR
jgi:hypothetical protein